MTLKHAFPFVKQAYSGNIYVFVILLLFFLSNKFYILQLSTFGYSKCIKSIFIYSVNP